MCPQWINPQERKGRLYSGTEIAPVLPVFIRLVDALLHQVCTFRKATGLCTVCWFLGKRSGDAEAHIFMKCPFKGQVMPEGTTTTQIKPKTVVPQDYSGPKPHARCWQCLQLQGVEPIFHARPPPGAQAKEMEKLCQGYHDILPQVHAFVCHVGPSDHSRRFCLAFA